MNKQKIIGILIGVVVVAALGYVFFLSKSDGGLNFKSLNFFGQKTEESPFGASTEENNASGFSEMYTNTDYGFSIRYPEGFNVSELPDDAGFTLLLQKETVREGFQIFISEFDEPGPLTPERVKQDLPDMVVDNPQAVIIGEKKDIPALIFLSDHESLGRVREVWFIYAGFLYQLTAYEDMDQFIGPILETLSFQ